ncbi:hypothetical protein [Roseateles sp.]|uniref:hypothetical protein n=1 Tax=Roseateles sp. TaxID=1971397 RepID=UPI002F4047D6
MGFQRRVAFFSDNGLVVDFEKVFAFLEDHGFEFDGARCSVALQAGRLVEEDMSAFLESPAEFASPDAEGMLGQWFDADANCGFSFGVLRVRTKSVGLITFLDQDIENLSNHFRLSNILIFEFLLEFSRLIDADSVVVFSDYSKNVDKIIGDPHAQSWGVDDSSEVTLVAGKAEINLSEEAKRVFAPFGRSDFPVWMKWPFPV